MGEKTTAARMTAIHAPFRLRHDLKANVLEASLHGFWSEDDRERFGLALQREIAWLRQAGRPFGLLFDLRGFGVQSAANIDAMIASSRPTSRRDRAPTAVVVGRALVRLQASRVLNVAEFRIFETREEAVAWLTARCLSNGSSAPAG